MEKMCLFVLLLCGLLCRPGHAVNVEGIVPGLAIGSLSGGIIGVVVGADVAVAPYTGGIDGGSMLVYIIGYTGARMVAGGLQGMLIGGVLGSVIGFLVYPSSETQVSDNVKLTK